MIDSTFYGLLSTQIEEMKSANSAQQNKLLLQIAKLALAEIDTSEGVMAEYDKLDTRVLFSTFGDIGVLIREFFEENKERLDPVALNGKIGEKLLETTAAIAETTDSIKQLEVTEAKLLSAEPQLRSLQAQYQDLKARLDELRTIQNVATPEILLQMEHDIAHLRTMTKEASEKKMQLQTVLDELSNAQQNMQNEQQLLGSGILDIVRKYDDTLSALLRTYGSSAQEVEQKITDYQAQYNRLEEVTSEYADQLAFWESNLGENSSIVASMQRYGTKSVADFLDDINSIKDTIMDDLKSYDLLIQKIVQYEESLRNAVSKRQNKR